MKVALVHDYLREYGGAERVVEVLHEMYPQAPLYTAFVDWGNLGEMGERFKSWDIRVSPVGNIWCMRKFHSPLRFLTPLVWESLDLSGFDVVISSSGWFISRGVITHPGQVHISYIHHPPRNLYGYATGSTQKNSLIRAYAGVINPFLRIYDYSVMQRVDYIIANSQETKRRIQKFYRREAEVIYPPVTISNFKFQISNSQIKNKSYFLSVGRLTYAKRVDLAIGACNLLKLPLKIIGTGKEEKYLRSIAGPTIELLGNVSDNVLQGLYTRAKALIFCALEEDFGMVPVEAMQNGIPVIALKQGGVMETVITGKTGLFFEKPETEALAQVLKQFLALKRDWTLDCTKWGQVFNKEVFIKKMSEFVFKVI